MDPIYANDSAAHRAAESLAVIEDQVKGIQAR